MSDGDAGGADGGSNGNEGAAAAVIMSTMMGGDDARAAKASKAEPYVEPDYGVVWAKRWRWMKPVLLLTGAGLVALLAWSTIGR